jgi:subtilisin-like proprotein convertase family protein
MLPFPRKRLVFALVFFCCAVFALAKLGSAGNAEMGRMAGSTTDTVGLTPTVTPTCSPRTWSNSAPITIYDNNKGFPYPSNITVGGVLGSVAKVTVSLTGVDHTWPDDLDVMLVGPGGQNTLLMSDAGGGNGLTNVNLQFDDAVPVALPDNMRISSGTFGPTNYDLTTDIFPAPAPTPGGPVAMGVFIGANPNGVWSLYVRDDLSLDSGAISGGWTLSITTTIDGCLTPTPTPTYTPTPTLTPTLTGTPTNTATNTPTPMCVTPVFTNYESIAINDNGPAGRYPATVAVSGLTGVVTKVTFELAGVQHTFPDDIDIMLVGPGGQNTLLMSDAGGETAILYPTFIFTDDAATTLPDQTQLFSGMFKPTNYDTDSDVFPAPAPSPGATVSLSVFNGTNPNGTWSLYVRDDTFGNCGPCGGYISGWRLHITTTSTTTCGTATATPTRTPTAMPTHMSPSPTPFAYLDFSPSTQDESQEAVITVRRDGNFNVWYGADFITYSGTAIGGGACTAGIDYISVHQFLSFAPGETTKTVTIPICGDDIQETDESFVLWLDTYVTQTAIVTINDTANTFRNSAGIAINDGAPSAQYPSDITVSGAPATIGSMRLTLYDYSDPFPDDTDFLLIGPRGQNMILMADAGGSAPGGPVTLNFRDTARAVVPDNGPLTAPVRDFEPTSYLGVANFPPPAPAGPYHEPGGAVGGTGTQTFYGNFGGTDPNGTWRLYVRDRTAANPPGAEIGKVQGGWGLEFSAATPAPTCAPANFANTTPITINDYPATGSPYPSNINVTGLPGRVAKVAVEITGVSHEYPRDIDMMLVGPGGQHTLVMSDAGRYNRITNLVFSFDDDEAAALSYYSQLVGGSFQPTNYEIDFDDFPGPAPTPGSTAALSVFNGANPNGTWSLYVRDDGGIGYGGSISGGWTLHITTTVGAGCSHEATASISGHVLTANGVGIRNAKVVITGNSLPSPIVVTTGSFGYFAFEGLATGETYVVTVNSRRYTFSAPSRVITLVDDVVDADFVADPEE